MQKNLLIKIVFFLFFVIPANSEIIKGTAVVVDGDTLKIDNKNFQWVFIVFDEILMDFLVFDEFLMDFFNFLQFFSKIEFLGFRV